jgi:FkbM family methyltransferase
MIRKLIKRFGLMPYLKVFRGDYFPSAGQKQEIRLMPSRRSFYSQFISKDDLCFDIGANIGNRTKVFLYLGAKVVAVEPQRECSRILNIRFGSKINLEQSALGESNGDGVIFISDTSEVSSLSKDWISEVSKSRFHDKQWKETELVTISTLDTLISKYGVPKFCKIDVEGFEEEVLKGLSQPIPIISFEYTVPERLMEVRNCINQLVRLGEFECNYTLGENMKFELDNWISKEALLDQIHNLSGATEFGDIYVRFR